MSEIDTVRRITGLGRIDKVFRSLRAAKRYIMEHHYSHHGHARRAAKEISERAKHPAWIHTRHGKWAILWSRAVGYGSAGGAVYRSIVRQLGVAVTPRGTKYYFFRQVMR